MAATTDNVGVRVFSNLTDTVASIDTRDSTVIGLCLPLPNMPDDTAIEVDRPLRISTEDTETLAKFGPGLAYDTFRQYKAEGIITDVLFVRAATGADLASQMGHIVGDANAKTGVWALLDGIGEVGLEPGLVQSPGYMSQRIDGGRNPVVEALATVSDRIIDCFVIGDTPETNREAAAEWADDWAAVYNVMGMYPQRRYFFDGATVTRPLSPGVAAAIVRRDKEVGNPYKASWNRPLRGGTGLSQPVSYRDGDTSHDANFLVQSGVGTVIEGNVLWNPYTTATDPATVGYRSFKRIRTRRSFEKAMLRPLRKFLSEDIGPHAVTLIFQSANEALEERQAVGALIEGSEVLWQRDLNPNNLLKKGGMRVKMRFEETPDLTDLGVYTEPQPEAFDILSDNIRAALERLGNPAIRYVAA